MEQQNSSETAVVMNFYFFVNGGYRLWRENSEWGRQGRERGEKKQVDVSGARKTVHTEINSVNFISEEKKQNYTHPNAYTLHHSHRLSCTESATWRETQGLHPRWGTLLWRAIALSVLMLSSFSMGSCVSHHSAVSSAGVKGLFLCYGLLCSLVYIYVCICSLCSSVSRDFYSKMPGRSKNQLFWYT